MSSSLRARFSSHVLRTDPGKPRLERKKVTVAGKTRVQYWIRPGRERDRTSERRQHRYQPREEVTEASTSRTPPLPISDATQHGMPSVSGPECGGRVVCSHTRRVDTRVYSHSQNVPGRHRRPPPDQHRHGAREARVRFRPNIGLSPFENERPGSVEFGAGVPSHCAAPGHEPISGRAHEDHLAKTLSHRRRPAGAAYQEETDSLFAQKLHELELGGGGKWELDILQWGNFADGKAYIDEHGPGRGARADAAGPPSGCCAYGSGQGPTPLLASGVIGDSAVDGKTTRGAICHLQGDGAVQRRDLLRRGFSQDSQIAEPDDAPPPYSLLAT
ncbi:hypothetical protein RB595_006786 [Gaeumannomyces hyphopodioides]